MPRHWTFESDRKAGSIVGTAFLLAGTGWTSTPLSSVVMVDRAKTEPCKVRSILLALPTRARIRSVPRSAWTSSRRRPSSKLRRCQHLREFCSILRRHSRNFLRLTSSSHDLEALRSGLTWLWTLRPRKLDFPPMFTCETARFLSRTDRNCSTYKLQFARGRCCNYPRSSAHFERARGPGILDFADKYAGSEGMASAARELPANISEELASKLRECASRVAAIFDVRGVARIDFLSDGTSLYVNEVNTIPGSLSRYLFIKPVVAFDELLVAMVNEAIERPAATYTSAGADGKLLQQSASIASKLG
jgi:hypothetical protein